MHYVLFKDETKQNKTNKIRRLKKKKDQHNMQMNCDHTYIIHAKIKIQVFQSWYGTAMTQKTLAKNDIKCLALYFMLLKCLIKVETPHS